METIDEEWPEWARLLLHEYGYAKALAALRYGSERQARRNMAFAKPIVLKPKQR